MHIRASDMDWDDVNWFNPSEFPGGVLDHVEGALIMALDDFRALLGQPIVPSPVPGGWCRNDGSTTSRHYAVERLSDAGDIFPQCDIRTALLHALGCEWFGGIGVYLDTTGPSGKPEAMLHLDMRPERVLWLRYEGRYIYPLRSAGEMAAFWQRLGEYRYDAA
ncbi:MAG: hypothetical protein OIF57_11730 [Marinobacterium sp.]|nr:hypothetical protein [Marinobacterium sp.]